MRVAYSTLMPVGPVAHGTIVSFVIRVAGIGIVMVQAILTARLLGPQGYGTVAFLLSLSTIFGTVVLLGTETLSVREVARLLTTKDGPALKGFISAVGIAVLAAAIAGVVLWLLVVLLGLAGRTAAAWSDLAMYAAFVFPLMAAILLSQGILRGYGHTAMSQIPFMVVRPLVLVVVLVIAVGFSLRIGPGGYLAAVVAAHLVALGLAAYMLRSATADLRGLAATAPDIGTLTRSATPFMAMSLLGAALAEVTTLMLMWWSDAEQTGLFQPIARIAPLLVLAMQAVSVRYAPRITELWTAGETERLASVTRKVTLVTTGFTLLSAAVLLLIAEPVLSLFGQEFAANARALWWIAGAQVFNAACGPAGLLLTMSGHAARALVPQLLGLAATLALGAALIPDSGAEGAAIAMAGGIVAWNVAMLIEAIRRVGIDTSLPGALLFARRQNGTSQNRRAGR